MSEEPNLRSTESVATECRCLNQSTYLVVQEPRLREQFAEFSRCTIARHRCDAATSPRELNASLRGVEKLEMRQDVDELWEFVAWAIDEFADLVAQLTSGDPGASAGSRRTRRSSRRTRAPMNQSAGGLTTLRRPLRQSSSGANAQDQNGRLPDWQHLGGAGGSRLPRATPP